jgi:hypothetical protein
MTAILAQIGGYSFSQLAIFLIVAVIVCGIVWIVIQQAKIPIPNWVWAILGLLALGFVAIFAIRLLMSM